MTNTLTALANIRDAAKHAEADSKFGSVMRFTSCAHARAAHSKRCIPDSDP